LTYLEGALEIRTNSRDHETLKKLLARLLEAWADETGVELEGGGSKGLRRGEKEKLAVQEDEPVEGAQLTERLIMRN
jgi:hypothetical protein